jgi:hypothetical protein
VYLFYIVYIGKYLWIAGKFGIKFRKKVAKSPLLKSEGLVGAIDSDVPFFWP